MVRTIERRARGRSYTHGPVFLQPTLTAMIAMTSGSTSNRAVDALVAANWRNASWATLLKLLIHWISYSLYGVKACRQVALVLKGHISCSSIVAVIHNF
jgi:hypothetical protein